MAEIQFMVFWVCDSNFIHNHRRCAFLWPEFKGNTEYDSFFSITILPCLFLIILYCNNRLIMHKDSFTYRTVFRKSYTYRMNDVISIKKIGLGLRVLKVPQKKFFIDESVPGMQHFVKRFPMRMR